MSVPSRGEVAGTGVGGGADRERLALSEQEPGWENSECNNTEGSYTCTCKAGYIDIADSVFRCKDPGTGLFTAPCSSMQSSFRAPGNEPWRALDGLNKEGLFLNTGSCSHTNPVPQGLEWWRVDLHDHLLQDEIPAIPRTIEEVQVWNRIDDAATIARLNGFKIWVTASNATSELDNLNNLCFTHTANISLTTSATSPIVAACGLSGRYVWITLSDEILTLCEVEIVGHSGGCEDLDECDAGAHNCDSDVGAPGVRCVFALRV